MFVYLSCYNKPMQYSFYFYDLETSGLNPRTDRIMQFAGQRTDLNLNPIGEPTNLLVQLDEDTLPSPGAIMVTGITPQMTRQDGISERDFCRFMIEEVATPGTTIIGYNSIRFDNEFIRHTLWRNFYDAYEWEWKERRSRWDLLDVVRMTRALRPEGIEWPFAEDGRATNRLELITKLNGIEHEHAHDALADVVALIEVTKLIKRKQPQLYEYLYHQRLKRLVKKLINLKTPAPFVYSSGRYSSKFEKTTVAYPIAEGKNGNVLVFDLRYNLDDMLAAEKDGTFFEKYAWKSSRRQRTPQAEAAANRAKETADRAKEAGEQVVDYYPIVKTLQYNRCPAVAPIGVLDRGDCWRRIGLSREQVEKNIASLMAHPDFATRMQGQDFPEYVSTPDPESNLYSAFTPADDLILCSAVRNNDAEDLKDFRPRFKDERLPELFMHYKAKNFPEILTEAESADWQKYRTDRLKAQSRFFFREMNGIKKSLAKGETFASKTLDECNFLAEELLLWYENLRPDCE